MGKNDDWMWEQIRAKNELLDEGILQEDQLVDDYVQNITHNIAVHNTLIDKAYKTIDIVKEDYDIDFWLDFVESTMRNLIDKGCFLSASRQLNVVINIMYDKIFNKHCR